MSSIRRFNDWFAINHPADWWASERNGESLPHRDRLRVSEFSRKAYEQGVRDERERAAKIADAVAKKAGIEWRAAYKRNDSSPMKVYNGRRLAAEEIAGEIRKED